MGGALRCQPQPSHYSGVEVPRVWEPTELIAGAFKGEVKPPGTYGYSNTNWIVLTELRPALEVTLWTKSGADLGAYAARRARSRLAVAARACSGLSLRRPLLKLMRSAGGSNTAPGVPSKDTSSI